MLLCRKALEGVSLLVVGLQEIEMGASSVTRAAVKEAIARHRATDSATHNGKWWSDEVLRCLQDSGASPGNFQASMDLHKNWQQVGLRQLSGMLLLVFARRELLSHISCVTSCCVPCGVGGFGGNKGAVAIRLQLHRQPFLFINSHFAAHQVHSWLLCEILSQACCTVTSGSEGVE